MLLLAIAVVFIGLGWHSAATSGEDASSDLEAAGRNAQTSAEQAPSTGSAKSAAPSSSPVSGAEKVGSVCVLNAGTVTGLAGDVSEALKSKGFEVSGAENLQTSSISENTIFYGEGEEDAAKTLAEAVPGEASPEPRPAAFSKCQGQLAVVVITR